MLNTSSNKNKKQVIAYRINNWSSYESDFHPNNILEDRPHDQSSRWLSRSCNPPQFLLLKLTSPAIVQELIVGKFEKPHVSDLKRFKVLGGIDEDNLMELLDSGLRDDDRNLEIFNIKHKINDVMFPCQFIKIVPIQTRSPNFGFSIWYIQLRGIKDAEKVTDCIQKVARFKETEAIRLCLKYFRQHDFMEAFSSLQKNTNVVLEDPLLTKLYLELVKQGNFESCENIIMEALHEDLFEGYVKNQDLKPYWTLLTPPSEGYSYHHQRPGMRGGHQMCLDFTRGTIYVFGGWDGTHDIGDLWAYNIHDNKWKLLSANVHKDGGPCNRSCHKMIIDRNKQRLYVLGRYVEVKSKTNMQIDLKNDFYYFDIASNKWILISADTEADGGPSLIYDHQMCLDHENERIYIFGGQFLKVLGNCRSTSVRNIDDETPLERGFSGFYLYDLRKNHWTKICNDCDGFKSSKSGIPSRTGHVMVFDDLKRKLYIFGGQKGAYVFSDFYVYDTELQEFSMVYDKFGRAAVPASGFTQRATIDSVLGEIYVFSGCKKDNNRKGENVCNSVWVFDLSSCHWSCVYQNDNNTENYWNQMQYLEPRPRYAHQLVYNPIKKTHYMFGGNPGKSLSSQPRLDDFWRLQLIRTTGKTVARRCFWLLRKQRYMELTTQDSVKALQYLQANLGDVIDHNSQDESEEFQHLASLLFDGISSKSAEPTKHYFNDRLKLFNTIVSFFPEKMTPPKSDLTDLIPF
ncbi:uncharacterized protein TRIADDRAFT_37030 [Trichoplax adhaerens]|uniref:Muskelin N-terminal domain-containing protein n=1 Tax=Trichoplax adhaerens TaxID=10228 RepID=B3RIC3_TRIAD|nr:hypothetical protein TRIADDRAFT_37030 [Trichoplax adhaerens]EDV28994.1 hypothetical protein TRIADDRAFT_37030 [Trichoplax adhaerens]|eukprot:XP_002108196.1 hypothetical protein TRIADDRAFT_37030 [Trichoplax adhaerens]